MKESPGQTRTPHDLGPEINSKDSTESEGHDVLTSKQRRRYSAVTVAGILAVPSNTSQAFDLAAAIGKVMRRDRTFEPLRNWDDALAVEIRPSQRDKVLRLLQLSSWTWRDYLRRWESVRMAHRCHDLGRGRVLLFLQPEDICPVCDQPLLNATRERGSEQRSRLPRATQTVLKAGDASRGEKGDARDLQDQGIPASAAIASLKRAGIKIGDPISDEQVERLGFKPTRKGWLEVSS